MNPHPDGTAPTQRPTKETHLPSQRNAPDAVASQANGSSTTWTTADADTGVNDFGRG